MTEQEAIETAIEALGIECDRLATEAREWQRHDDDQPFNRQEGQNSANIIARYQLAIGILEKMVNRSRASGQHPID